MRTVDAFSDLSEVELETHIRERILPTLFITVPADIDVKPPEFDNSKLADTLKNMIGRNEFIVHNNQSYPMEFLLSLTHWGRQLLTTAILLNNALATLVYNQRIDFDCKYQGQSVAFHCLLDSRNVSPYDAQIARTCMVLINQAYTLEPETLNSIVRYGLSSDQSVAFLLVNNNVGLLKLKHSKAPRIHETCLNTVIPNPHGRGERSVLVELLKTKQGLSLLKANNYGLVKSINENNLNAVQTSGMYQGRTVASIPLAFLLNQYENNNFFSADNFRLANLISEDSLNRVITAGQYQGHSLAFQFAANVRGHTILTANNNRLLNSINKAALTAVMLEGTYCAQSALMLLLESEGGLRILKANDYCLLKWIDENDLNTVCQSGVHQGESLAYSLAQKKAYELFAANDARLMNFISEKTLNDFIQVGPAGRSLAFELASSHAGRLMLIANNSRLLNAINQRCLYQQVSVLGRFFEFKSVASLLLENADTQEIVNYLSKKLNYKIHLVPPKLEDWDIEDFFLDAEDPIEEETLLEVTLKPIDTNNYHVEFDLTREAILSLKISKKMKITFSSSVSEKTLRLFHELGYQLSEITMYIDEKYFGKRVPDTELIQPKNQSEPSIGIFHQTNKSLVACVQLKNLKNRRVNEETQSKAISAMELNSDTPVFVVFAGRKEDAYLPPVSGRCRCLVVLTKVEYDDLNIDPCSKLSRDYHLLTVPERKKADGTRVDPGKLTERRRAAFLYLLERGVKTAIFMDDNVTEIAYKPIEAYPINSLEGLCHTMLSQMQTLNEPFVSVSTHSQRLSPPKPNQLGCKVWGLNLSALQEMLPGNSIHVCFPDNAAKWGEDYYLQVLLHTLTLSNSPSENHEFGFQVLDPNVIQLHRATSLRSSCVKSGVRVSQYDLSDVMSSALQAEIAPKLLETIKKGIFLFNHLVQREQARYQQKLYKVIHDDPALRRECSGPLKQVEVLLFEDRLSLVLRDDVDLADSFTLKPHQKEAIRFVIKNLNTTQDFVFDMATGTGKSVLMLLFAMASFAANPDKNVVILCPTIQLVHQLLKNIRGKYKPLLDWFGIDERLVYGVCSELLETNEVVSRQYLAINKTMNEGAQLLIFCEDSWSRCIEHDQGIKFLDRIGLVIVDESHLQANMIAKLHALDTGSRLYFSATPKLIANSQKYVYSRQQAILDNMLSPVVVDKTLPEGITFNQIVTLLRAHQHPNGGNLEGHKGIIYVNSIDKANALSAFLRQKLPQTQIYAIHSKENSDKLDAFTNSTEASIAIAVDMLVAGYDEDYVDYIIFNKPVPQKDNLNYLDKMQQALGRALRKVSNTSDKIAYFICHPIAIEGIETCFPAERVNPNLRSVAACLQSQVLVEQSFFETTDSTNFMATGLNEAFFENRTDDFWDNTIGSLPK